MHNKIARVWFSVVLYSVVKNNWKYGELIKNIALHISDPLCFPKRIELENYFLKTIFFLI